MTLRPMIQISGIFLLTICGCSETPDGLATVTGRVTINGRPVEAEITFQPERNPEGTSSRASVGIAGPDGEFTLGHSADRDGAVVGHHHVTIKLPRVDPAESGADSGFNMVPSKTTHLQRTVGPGHNEFRFALTE